MCPCCAQSDIDVQGGPYYRHQVFDIPKPTVDITEYRLFSGQCRHCKETVKAQKPDDASQGIIGPNLLSYIGVLAGQYHLSVRKIQSLLKEQLGTTFSVGAISEAQTKVASMLTPLHQAIKQALKKATLIHADETSHHRNDETSLRWCWLVASDDLVYEQILYSRSTSSAKKVIDEDSRPTDFIQISGTDDDVVPLGPTQSPASVAALGQVPPVRTSVERLAEAFSCPPPETTQVAPLTSTRWAPCAGGTTVRLDEVTGLVHIYPIVPGYQGTDQIMAVWGWPPFDPTGRG